jgi:hypothetical protein
MKRIPVTIRLPEATHDLLRQASVSYRSPSVNWFVGEMVTCMVNPARIQDFINRLLSGAIQEQISLGQSDANPRRGVTRKRVSRRGKRGGPPV